MSSGIIAALSETNEVIPPFYDSFCPQLSGRMHC